MYPEFARLGFRGPLDPSNHVYGCVRETLRLLQLDAAYYGSPDWNPLRAIVRPGNRVLIGRAQAMEGERNFEPWAEELEESDPAADRTAPVSARGHARGLTLV
jgi:hypothetical protein